MTVMITHYLPRLRRLIKAYSFVLFSTVICKTTNPFFIN